MASKNLGPGVSGYLNPDDRAWETTVFQAGKPVLDKELNLQQDVDGGAGQLATKLAMPSGWLSADFLATSDMDEAIFIASLVANQYEFPACVAHVNGWLVKVTDTNVNTGGNAIDLTAAPVGAGVKRADLVILEVWRKLLSPAPSLDGKSPSGRIWRNGNVKIAPADDGLLNFPDDIKDVTLGAESTKRVQIQYRIRVIPGVDIFANPTGMEDPTVFAHSVPPNAVTPDGAATLFTYLNQIGVDNGLWRAGDGIPTNALGTVDGYMYAIPLTAVFRRNLTAFARVTNQNGGVVSPGPSDRPDGYLTDIVVPADVADLRYGVSPVGWNYADILAKNINYLLDNKLRTEWWNTPPLQGAGYNGHTVFMTNEIGVSTLNGGVPPDTGDGAGGELIGQFDANRRIFSDRSTYETLVVKIPAPGLGWVPGSVVTIVPSALEIPPYGPFNWTAYNPNTVMIVDVVDGWWIGSPPQVTRRIDLTTVTGLGVLPVNVVTLTIGAIAGYGLTNEDLYVTITVAYPRGLGLTKTPTAVFADTLHVNNPAQLPAVAPVSFAGMAPSNAVDFPHREVQMQYLTVPLTTAVLAANTDPGFPPPGWNFFRLNERASSIVSVSVAHFPGPLAPIVGLTTLSPDGRTVTFLNPLDFTVPGDTLQVTYVAIRPLPQNNEQVSVYYEARAPQAIRTNILGLRFACIPRYVGPEVYCMSTGSGSEDEGYPYPSGYVQIGGIYPSSVGVFNGDHELAASAQLAITDFSAETGLLKLPTFVGYTPAPEEVSFIRGLADIDAEDRSYFNTPQAGVYIPNAFAQQLADQKRHRNFVPMIAELVSQGPLGQVGQLVLVLFIREAFADPINGINFEPLIIDTTTASVFHLKGRLLNKGA